MYIEQCVWMELDGTCYVDETLLCYMYMELCAGHVICLLLNISIYVIYICCENCWIKKTEKRDNMQALCRLPPTAKGSLPLAANGKEATWQATVLPGRLTNLVSLPSAADGKGFAVRSGRQRPAINHLME